jgi:hypothetical protein
MAVIASRDIAQVGSERSFDRFDFGGELVVMVCCMYTLYFRTSAVSRRRRVIETSSSRADCERVAGDGADLDVLVVNGDNERRSELRTVRNGDGRIRCGDARC